MFESDDSLPPVLRNDDVTWLSTHELSGGLFSLSLERKTSLASPEIGDVLQGFHGGFFLSGVISLINTRNECVRDFKGHPRNGLLEYAFYKNDGTTVRVRINDLLPTKNGKLVFAQAPNNRFWCPLLEKAYAKFLGGYQNLSLCSLEEIIQPLTGNLLNSQETSEYENNSLSNWIRNECEKNHPVICKTKHSNGNNGEHGRAIAVIGVTSSNNEDLICVRDPMKTTTETIKIGDFKREFDFVATCDQYVYNLIRKAPTYDTFGRCRNRCKDSKLFG
ncbi:unnamed protein product [Caenorhabditis brenneri]